MVYQLNNMNNPAETFTPDLSYVLKQTSYHLDAQLFGVKANLMNYSITYDKQVSGYYVAISTAARNGKIDLSLNRGQEEIGRLSVTASEFNKSHLVTMANMIKKDIEMNNVIANSEPVRVKTNEMQVAIDELNKEQRLYVAKKEAQYRKYKDIEKYDVDHDGVKDIYEQEFSEVENVDITEDTETR